MSCGELNAEAMKKTWCTNMSMLRGIFGSIFMGAMT